MSKTAAALVAFFCLTLFALPMSAQLLPNGGNVYAGALYGKADYITNYYGFHGWAASVEGLPFKNPHVGITVDTSGMYRPGVTEYNILLGPRLSIEYGKWRPFAQLMGGVVRLKSGGISYLPVAWDIGGGVDYRLGKFLFLHQLAWRIQADYTHSRVLSASQKDFRASTGFVWRF